MPWFRLYNETVYDPKIRALSLEGRWTWIACLCLASASPIRGELRMGDVTRYVTVTSRVITDASSLPRDDVEKSLVELQTVGLISVDEEGLISISNWSKRQKGTDSAAERQKRYRARKKVDGDESLRNASRNALRDCYTGEVRSKNIDIYRDDASFSPEEKEILQLIDPYTMTPKEIRALRSKFNLDHSEILAAMSHPKAKTIKSAYLYLLNWFKRAAGRSAKRGPSLSEFQKKVSGMFDEFAAKWPNRDCLGEARTVFLSLFPEEEPREVARERARRINAHAVAYLSRTDPQFCMRLSKWLRSTEFDLSPEAPQPGPEYEVAANG